MKSMIRLKKLSAVGLATLVLATSMMVAPMANADRGDRDFRVRVRNNNHFLHSGAFGSGLFGTRFVSPFSVSSANVFGIGGLNALGLGGIGQALSLRNTIDLATIQRNLLLSNVLVTSSGIQGILSGLVTPL